MSAQKYKRCRRYVDSCSYCLTGVYKRPARRKARVVAKRALRAELRDMGL